MNNEQNWGRREKDAGQNKAVVIARHINTKPKTSAGSLSQKTKGNEAIKEMLLVTRMQTMFFKVLQSKKTIDIETSHIYGATGAIQLALDDLKKYRVLMEVLEKQQTFELPVKIEDWCRIARDPEHKGLMISIEPGQLSTGMLCFGPREMETLQIRALLKIWSAVQMVGAEMLALADKEFLCV